MLEERTSSESEEDVGGDRTRSRAAGGPRVAARRGCGRIVGASARALPSGLGRGER